MMMMAGVRRAGSTFTELLALLHVLHALKRFDLQNFVDFGFEGIAFWSEVAEACLGVGVTRAAESHVYHCCAP